MLVNGYYFLIKIPRNTYTRSMRIIRTTTSTWRKMTLWMGNCQSNENIKICSGVSGYALLRRSVDKLFPPPNFRRRLEIPLTSNPRISPSVQHREIISELEIKFHFRLFNEQVEQALDESPNIYFCLKKLIKLTHYDARQYTFCTC